MPFPFVALFGLIKVACVVCGAVFCAHKVTKAYKRNQDLKEKKLEYSQEEKRAARERNQQVQPKLEEKEKEHDKQETKNKQLEKELEEAKSKANDPNLPKEQKQYWRNRVIELEDEIKRGKNKSKNLFNEIKGLKDQIDKNNKIINSTNLTFDPDRNWIWEVLTLENILVCLAIYALYNIVRDERKH